MTVKLVNAFQDIQGRYLGKIVLCPEGLYASRKEGESFFTIGPFANEADARAWILGEVNFAELQKQV